MKRHACLFVLLPGLFGWAGMTATAFAQAPAPETAAREAAAREEAEDRYRRMSARLEEVVANQALQQQQISALEKSLGDLRDQVVRANNNAVTPASLQGLGEQIRKVDETRASENRKITETLDELSRLVRSAAVGPPPSHTPAPHLPTTATGTDSGGGSDKVDGFDYVVQKNDTLGGIVQAYRTQNIKVTSKSIMDANPTVKWDRLRVGQKIFIPKPKS